MQLRILSFLISYVADMKFRWCSRTTSQYLRGRILLDLDPDMKTFTITMPSVGVFVIGTAVCCYCCFKYGLKRWYDRLLKGLRDSRTKCGITYLTSLEYKKKQLEEALKKVTRLQYDEPHRKDLKHEAVGLKEEIFVINDYLRNSARYAAYSKEMMQRNLDTLASRRVSSDTHESSFLNPIFSSQQSVDCGYLIDPVKGDDAANFGSCCNPKHKELEMFLMGKGGVKRSLLTFPASPTTSPTAVSPLSSSGRYDYNLSAHGSQTASPQGNQGAIDEQTSPINSPLQQGVSRHESQYLPETVRPNTPELEAAQPQGKKLQTRPGSPNMQKFGSTSRGGPDDFPGPNQDPRSNAAESRSRLNP